MQPLMHGSIHILFRYLWCHCCFCGRRCIPVCFIGGVKCCTRGLPSVCSFTCLFVQSAQILSWAVTKLLDSLNSREAYFQKCAIDFCTHNQFWQVYDYRIIATEFNFTPCIVLTGLHANSAQHYTTVSRHSKTHLGMARNCLSRTFTMLGVQSLSLLLKKFLKQKSSLCVCVCARASGSSLLACPQCQQFVLKHCT